MLYQYALTLLTPFDPSFDPQMSIGDSQSAADATRSARCPKLLRLLGKGFFRLLAEDGPELRDDALKLQFP